MPTSEYSSASINFVQFQEENGLLPKIFCWMKLIQITTG
ncbi:hypothetical protein XBP1_1510009 [Xenorhabdus bovienii str. puntauvense]|uniref:Uncharacterized protein n=1 Tax=Xenorhabdus bovienii str. puntauvense TaxID=1398201 RepID=A0A077N9M8_XENBV|nr:hypothetical protein XBP1_1510009 [Xenorhabdus bovienii str. puntauvense]